MKRTKIVALVLLSLLINSPFLSAEEIPVINDTQLDLNVWFLNSDESAWMHLPLQSKQQSLFRYEGDGLFFVVAIPFDSPAEHPIGWISLTMLKNRSPSAALVIESKYVKRTKKVCYTVCKPVWQTRTEEKTYWYRQFINGRYVLVPRTVTENNPVCRMVREQRVKTVVYKVMGLSASAHDNEGPMVSRVTFKTQKEGAWIKYRLVAGKQETLLSNPTTTTEDIPVGWYYIWSERDGKKTSEKIPYRINEKQKTITIPEIR